MKKNEITIGGTYLAKVSDKVVPVRIDAVNRFGGWDATNLLTNKKVRIKSAQRLRCPANGDGSPQGKNEIQHPIDAAKKTPKAQTKPETKPKKLSALDAAAKVLGETGQAMNCQEMIEAMAAKGYWTSPAGQTPHATLYAAILREIATKRKESRFVETERGRFQRSRAGE